LSFLYLIAPFENGAPSCDSPVKIGITGNLPGRLRALQSGSPTPLRYAEVWDFTTEPTLARAIEQKILALYQEKILHGEWLDMLWWDLKVRCELAIATGCYEGFCSLGMSSEEAVEEVVSKLPFGINSRKWTEGPGASLNADANELIEGVLRRYAAAA
jgi:hypothetical protein